jgi:GNAT superfamily N-acetyltransferase
VRTRYPAELEQPGLLRDGRSVFIRPVRAADQEAMLDFARRLSRRTLAQRLLGPVPRFHRELLRQFVDVDYADHLALAAFLDDQMIGTGRLIRLEDTDHAEVTFTVADEFQGMGLGTLLLERLARSASTCSRLTCWPPTRRCCGCSPPPDTTPRSLRKAICSMWCCASTNGPARWPG